MRNNLFLILTLALFVEGAGAISRIGNNAEVPGANGELKDTTDGWVAAIPDGYPDWQTTGPRSVDVESDTQTADRMQDSGFGPPVFVSITADPFSVIYPALTSDSESALISYMQIASGFQITEVKKDSCSYFLYGENSTGYVGIARWGTSGIHGYVVTALKSDGVDGKSGIMSILNSTKLYTPCSP